MQMMSVCLLERCIDRQDALADEIKALEMQIKQAVLEHGESVSIPPVSALLVGGRTSWDGKGALRLCCCPS